MWESREKPDKAQREGLGGYPFQNFLPGKKQIKKQKVCFSMIQPSTAFLAEVTLKEEKMVGEREICFYCQTVSSGNLVNTVIGSWIALSSKHHKCITSNCVLSLKSPRWQIDHGGEEITGQSKVGVKKLFEKTSLSFWMHWDNIP